MLHRDESCCLWWITFARPIYQLPRILLHTTVCQYIYCNAWHSQTGCTGHSTKRAECNVCRWGSTHLITPSAQPVHTTLLLVWTQESTDWGWHGNLDIKQEVNTWPLYSKAAWPFVVHCTHTRSTCTSFIMHLNTRCNVWEITSLLIHISALNHFRTEHVLSWWDQRSKFYTKTNYPWPTISVMPKAFPICGKQSAPWVASVLLWTCRILVHGNTVMYTAVAMV